MTRKIGPTFIFSLRPAPLLYRKWLTTGDRQRLSQPDAQSLSKVTPLDVGWSYADIRHKKQTSQWQAVQAGLQPGLDRPVG
jgi:hypothetical protein